MRTLFVCVFMFLSPWPTLIAQPATKETSIQSAIASEYPLPIALAPDGIHLLYRRLISDLHQGLEVEDLNTGLKTIMPDLPGEAMRAVWAPDSSHIAFYLQPQAREQRVLYIWDIKLNHVVPTATVGLAEASLQFSFDGRSILTLDERAGIVVTQMDGSEHRISLEQKVISAAYSLNSNSIGYVTATKPDTITVVDDSTQIEHAIQVGAGISVQNLSWQPDGSKIAVIYEQAGQSGIGTVDTHNGEFTRIFSAHRSTLRDLGWLGHGYLVFMCGDPLRLESQLFIKPSDSKGQSKIRAINGLADLRGTSYATDRIAYVVRGSYPANFIIWSVATDREIVRKSRTELPSQPALRIKLPDVYSTTALWWRCKHPTGAIVRFHGRGADEYPVWQADIQYFLSRNIDYLSVDYDPKTAVDPQYGEALLYTVKSFLQQAKIEPSSTVLFGFSAGADFLINALRGSSIQYKRAVLWGVNVPRNMSLFQRPWSAPTPLLVVEGTQDEGNDIRGLNKVTHFIKPEQIVPLEDTHLLTHLNTWVKLQSLLASSAFSPLPKP